MTKCEFKLKRKVPISKIIWLVVLAIVVGFFTKVWLWEKSYYAEKTGSERATAVNNAEPDDENIEVDETVPTEQEIKEYNVAPDAPRYLSIPSIGISKSRILPMGLTSSGAIATPNNIFDVGWYTGSDKPGSGGTAVIDGHNGGPHVVGVFKYLPDVKIGESIIIERGNGETLEYRVVDSKAIPLSEADAYMANSALVSPEEGRESVTLITCTGTFMRKEQTYDHRQFVRAVLVK